MKNGLDEKYFFTVSCRGRAISHPTCIQEVPGSKPAGKYLLIITSLENSNKLHIAHKKWWFSVTLEVGMIFSHSRSRVGKADY